MERSDEAAELRLAEAKLWRRVGELSEALDSAYRDPAYEFTFWHSHHLAAQEAIERRESEELNYERRFFVPLDVASERLDASRCQRVAVPTASFLRDAVVLLEV